MNHGGCNELCINTGGSYHCSCPPGQRLEPDQVSCRPIGTDVRSCHNYPGVPYCVCALAPEGSHPLGRGLPCTAPGPVLQDISSAFLNSKPSRYNCVCALALEGPNGSLP